MKEEREKNMSEKIVVCLEKGGARDMAEASSRRTNTPISEKPGRKAIDATAGMVKLTEGNSVKLMPALLDPVDVIYLDPMFPARQKSSLINKKLQLIQKLEPPCSQETDLFDAAISAEPDKIIVKRPLKSEFLAGRKPSYTLSGKAIRYDCYTL